MYILPAACGNSQKTVVEHNGVYRMWSLICMHVCVHIHTHTHPAAVWQQLVVGQKTVVELESSARSERETLMRQKALLEQEIHELTAARVSP